MSLVKKYLIYISQFKIIYLRAYNIYRYIYIYVFSDILPWIGTRYR